MGCVNATQTTQVTKYVIEEEDEVHRKLAARVIKRYELKEEKQGMLSLIEWNVILTGLRQPLNDPLDFKAACVKYGGTPEGVTLGHLTRLLKESPDMREKVERLLHQNKPTVLKKTMADGVMTPMCAGCSGHQMTFVVPQAAERKCWECDICEAVSCSDYWTCPSCHLTVYCTLCWPRPIRKSAPGPRKKTIYY